MFAERFKKSASEDITRNIEPYRKMTVVYEVDQKLTDFELELTGYNRHLLTSNDRYQMAAAYLSLARNRAILMDALYDKLTDPNRNSKELPEEATATIDFLTRGYGETRNGLDAADSVIVQTGFNAGDREVNELERYTRGLVWSSTEVLSPRFISGAVDAIDVLVVNITSQFHGAVTNNKLPNDFKATINKEVGLLLKEAENRKKSIDRLTGGITSNITSASVMVEIYKDLQEAFAIIDQATIWLTMPRLVDQGFTLKRPLNENQPTAKRFNPNALGAPVIKAAQVATPIVPAKPFNPGSLAPAAPSAKINVPVKTFSASILLPKPPKKNFDPSTLAAQPVDKSSKPFAPSDLGK